MARITRLATKPTGPSLNTLIPSFTLSLQAGNKSKKTVDTYGEALRFFSAFLDERGMPTAVGAIERAHVEAFVAHLLDTKRPATAANRFRSLQQFFRWAVEEGEITESPMSRLHPPKVPVEPPAVLGEEEYKRLLKACAGNDFEARRDTAIIRLMLDTGMRRAELCRLTLGDVDLLQKRATVVGKGGKVRFCPFGTKTAQALDRYMRMRPEHREAARPALWLGRAGVMTDSGIYQVIRDRALAAGLGHLHPHQLRHGFAHHWLMNGGQESDLMHLAGWSSRAMVNRYGASAAAERAREAHKRLSLGDRV